MSKRIEACGAKSGGHQAQASPGGVIWDDLHCLTGKLFRDSMFKICNGGCVDILGLTD